MIKFLSRTIPWSFTALIGVGTVASSLSERPAYLSARTAYYAAGIVFCIMLLLFVLPRMVKLRVRAISGRGGGRIKSFGPRVFCPLTGVILFLVVPQLLPRDAFQGEVLEGLNEAKKRAAAAEATAVETRNELQLIGNDSRERDQLVVKQLAQLQELLGSSRDSEEWREQANRLNIDPDLNETERKRLAIKMTKKLVDASKAILLASEPHSEELTQEMKDAIMNLKDALLTKDFGRAIQIIDEMPVRPEPAEMLKPSSPPSAPTGLRVIGG